LARLIPEDKISEIRQAADIVDIVSEYVRLKKGGKNFLGLCPFHSEKTPSFTVSPEKQIFHCFGCGESGSVFNFLMKQEGISFPQAVRELARRYGISLPSADMSPEEKKALDERQRLFAIQQEAMSFFQRQFRADRGGRAAAAYLERRAMTEETLRAFHIGWAPDRWDGILRHFASRSVSPALLQKAGLVIRRDDGSGFYDRFRGRIIFPIFDT